MTDRETLVENLLHSGVATTRLDAEKMAESLLSQDPSKIDHTAMTTLKHQLSGEDEKSYERSEIENLKKEIADLKKNHEVFHNRIEELHHKVSSKHPSATPVYQEPSLSALDSMMQQPADMNKEYQEETKNHDFEAEVEDEIKDAESHKEKQKTFYDLEKY